MHVILNTHIHSNEDIIYLAINASDGEAKLILRTKISKTLNSKN